MSEKIVQYWTILVEGGGPAELEPVSKFFPGEIALSHVEGLEQVPRPLGSLKPSNKREPTAGNADQKTPLEFLKLKIYGDSYQEGKNYDAIMANNGPNVSKMPYTRVKLTQWTSVEAAGPMIKTMEFDMVDGPCLINVLHCQTLLPTETRFEAEILWAGRGILTRRTIDGEARVPFTEIRCADSDEITVMRQHGS